MEGRQNPGDGRRFQREIVIVVAVDGGTPGGARSIEAPAPALRLCLRVVCSGLSSAARNRVLVDGNLCVGSTKNLLPYGKHRR